MASGVSFILHCIMEKVLVEQRMEVWNMYHGLQFAKIINLLLMALNILRNSKLFGIIQMEILFTLTVVSARYLTDISDSV